MSTAAWVSVALAALFGVHFVQNPWIAFPTAAIALWILRRDLNPYARLLVLAVAGWSGYRGHHATTEFLAHRDAVYRSMGANARCTGSGVVTESPVFREGKFVVLVETAKLDCGVAISGKNRVRLVGAPAGLARGDAVEFTAQLGPVAPLRQFDLTDPIPRAASLGVVASGGALDVETVRVGHGWRHAIDKARGWVRRRIVATYAPRAEALGRALVLGENDLEPSEQLAFQRSGLSHLLAVSGTHLVFAVVSVVSGLRALLLRFPRIASRCDVGRRVAPLGAILGIFYADFAGGSGSAWRAAWMLVVVYWARTFERKLGGMRALALSICVVTVYDPLSAYDVSFLLSALATAGLVAIGPQFKVLVEGVCWPPLRWLVGGLSTTLAAMIPCAPLLLLMAPDITLAGLVANVLAGPLGEMAALPLCLLHAISAPFPTVEQGIALAGSGALLSVAFLAKASAAVEWARVGLPPPTGAQLAILGLFAAAMATHGRAEWRASPLKEVERRLRSLKVGCATILCLFAAEVRARSSHATRGILRITAVDVGQGDSLLVDLPDGRLMVVDGGGAITGGPDPGPRILLPLLRMRRRDHIDIAVLTHPHPDHFGGLLSLLRGLPVREFWDGGVAHQSEKGELAQLRRELADRGTRLVGLPELCQKYSPEAGGTIQLLGPCPDLNASASANNQSIVLKLQFGRRSVVLPGDAEVVEETQLIAARGTQLRADLLKLGHHGSRSSTGGEWLAAVQPSAAFVSVGLRNRFGHPHPTTLSRLHAAAVPVFRTDYDGSIEWSTDGSKVVLRCAATRTVLTL